MKNRCLLLLSILLPISGCSANNNSSTEDVFKEYSKITYEGKTYSLKETTKIKIARYRSLVPEITQVKTYVDNLDRQFIYAYFSSNDGFLDKAEFTYTCQSSYKDFTQTVSLIEDMGEFLTYQKVYYNEATKQIKYEDILNVGDSNINSDEMTGRELYPASIIDERMKVLTDEHALGLTFDYKKVTTIIEATDTSKLSIN